MSKAISTAISEAMSEAMSEAISEAISKAIREAISEATSEAISEAITHLLGLDHIPPPVEGTHARLHATLDRAHLGLLLGPISKQVIQMVHVTLQISRLICEIARLARRLQLRLVLSLEPLMVRTRRLEHLLKCGLLAGLALDDLLSELKQLLMTAHLVARLLQHALVLLSVLLSLLQFLDAIDEPVLNQRMVNLLAADHALARRLRPCPRLLHDFDQSNGFSKIELLLTHILDKGGELCGEIVARREHPRLLSPHSGLVLVDLSHELAQLLRFG